MLFLSIVTATFSLKGQVDFNENILFSPTGLFIRGTSDFGLSNIEVLNFETNAFTTTSGLGLDYYFDSKWNLSGGISSAKISFNNFEKDFNRIRSANLYAGINYNYPLLTKTKIYIGIGALHSIAYNSTINSSIDNSETEIKGTLGSNTLLLIEAGLKYEFLNPCVLHLSFSNNQGLANSNNKENYNLKIANQLLFHLGVSFKL